MQNKSKQCAINRDYYLVYGHTKLTIKYKTQGLKEERCKHKITRQCVIKEESRSAQKPLCGPPSQINPLVNKLEYKDYNIDPPSLDYHLYLDPSSFSYQRASLSLVFTSFPNPTIITNCDHHKMAWPNASQELQNNSQHSELVRYVSRLRTSQRIWN